MDYTEVSITVEPKHPWAEIILQDLADIGFDSFVEEPEKVLAYIPDEDFKEKDLETLVQAYKEKEVTVSYSIKKIPTQNWNETWENEYKAITIGKELLIRAPFHEDDGSYKLSIEIQPQMSFGTGHHQTTFLLSQTLLNLDLKGKKVLDVGTGTGILGIIASKRGASSVFGNDIDELSIENAIENRDRNKIENFLIKKGSIEIVPNEEYDVIIANINRNVLIEQMEDYSRLCKNNGTLLLSGFYEDDIIAIVNVAENYGFNLKEILTKETWAVLKLEKV